MNANELQALRALAEKATTPTGVPIDPGNPVWGPRLKAFRDAASPSTVIALLDEIEKITRERDEALDYYKSDEIMYGRLINEARQQLAAVTAARDRLYEIAKVTFALHLMTPALADECDALRKAGTP